MTADPGWVLVVDDDATARLFLFRLLEQNGHRATVADNGASALELLRVEPFDLVLLDLVMPDLDGCHVLQTMKNDIRLRDIPVIVISAADELRAVVHCIELGADDYLAKPVDPVLLRARVDATLTRARLRQREAEQLDVIGHVAQAALAIADDNFDPQRLDPVARRSDTLGQLARAVQELATQVSTGQRRPGEEGATPPEQPNGEVSVLIRHHGEAVDDHTSASRPLW